MVYIAECGIFNSKRRWKSLVSQAIRSFLQSIPVKQDRMKAILYAITFLLLPLSLPAQTYYPFPTDSATWSVEEYYYAFFPDPDGCIARHYGMVGDTVIGNQTYSKLYGNNRPSDYPWEDTTFNYPTATYVAAVREDSSRKVWVVNAGETQDILYYDFALDVGDTFCFDYFSFVGCWPVIMVDSIQIGSNYRRQIHFLPFNSETWIEGIGSTTGWFEWQLTGNFAWQLLCFKENGNQLYGTGYCHCDTYTGMGIQDGFEKLSIYPNPAGEELVVDFGQPILEPCQISIHSTLGQELMSQETTQSKTKINLRELEGGLYFIRIRDGQGLTRTMRMMKAFD
jgi:hypothetical protein